MKSEQHWLMYIILYNIILYYYNYTPIKAAHFILHFHSFRKTQSTPRIYTNVFTTKEINLSNGIKNQISVK